MTEDNAAHAVHDSSDGGMSGQHPAPGPFELLVAPSTASELNKAKLRLIPVACWRVDDIRFAFDSSFVTPDVAIELKMLASLRESHKQTDIANQKTQYPPLSVFGHADPVGSDDYNKSLSGRRATVVYALLISNSDAASAVRLWNDVAQTENWGDNQRQAMQATTGLPAGTPDSKLFQAYMQKLLPPEVQLSRTDFLAQGADAGGKGDYQGCSEFNPLLIFSQEQENQFQQATDTTARNLANAPNRRVLVFLFRPGSQVTPSKWPCPRAKEDKSGCIKRFWLDGNTRRSTQLPNQSRRFEDTHDTFACRFYQRLTTNSPCERILASFRVRLFDVLGQPVPNALYRANEGSPPTGTALADGTVVLSDILVPSTCTIAWRFPDAATSQSADASSGTDSFPYSMSVYIDINGEATQDGASSESLNEKQLTAQRQLHNLGFSMGDSLADNIRFFQREFGAVETGQLADIEDVLNGRYSACNPPSRYKSGDGPTLPPAQQASSGPLNPDPLPSADPLAGEES